jgi:hypothetical protein
MHLGTQTDLSNRERPRGLGDSSANVRYGSYFSADDPKIFMLGLLHACELALGVGQHLPRPFARNSRNNITLRPLERFPKRLNRGFP